MNAPEGEFALALSQSVARVQGWLNGEQVPDVHVDVRRLLDAAQQQLTALAAVEELDLEDENVAGMLLADGHEHAFVGTMYRFGILEPIACYDIDGVLEGLMRDGMTADEAQEFFEFNIIGAWAGDRTPCFMKRCKLPARDGDQA